MMIGNDDVIRTWNAARMQGEAPTEEGANPLGILIPWARVLMAMRRDCGHPDTELELEDIIAVFVNDLHKYAGAIPKE